MLLLMFASLPFSASGAYINDPERITRFTKVRETSLEPGDTADIKFALENRYEKNMTNVTLVCEIYQRLTIYGIEEIDDEHPPLLNGVSPILELDDIPDIENNTYENIIFTVNTHKKTPDGTYMMRFNLTFDYQNETYNMKSRGFFNDSQWYSATHEKGLSYGMVNFTKLGVDGIVSDFAFAVIKYFPMWAFWALVSTAVLFGLLALGFHLQEEYGTFPRLEIAYQWGIGKLRSFKRMLER